MMQNFCDLRFAQPINWVWFSVAILLFSFEIGGQFAVYGQATVVCGNAHQIAFTELPNCWLPYMPM